MQKYTKIGNLFALLAYICIYKRFLSLSLYIYIYI